MARKFLYVVAALIALVLAAGIIWSLFAAQLMTAAMVPSADFKPVPAAPEKAWASMDRWIARPGMAQDPSLYLPEGAVAEDKRGKAAVFFIHPTTFLDRKGWNAPLDDKEANDLAALMVRGQASAFAGAGDVWAPRYRQATFGAFLTDQPERQKALDAAYADVATAFDQFVWETGDPPIILVGHSQGALHLMRLMQEKIAGRPIAKRVVAAYVVGWPVSTTGDAPAMGFPACTTPDATGCLLSWQSFAEPADPAIVKDVYDKSTGFDGKPRKGTPMVCTNPITGTERGTAKADANLGTLKTAVDLKSAKLIKGGVPARCDETGFLLIGPAPDMGNLVFPGNNYHIYDFSLFWANVRADANRRVVAFAAK